MSYSCQRILSERITFLYNTVKEIDSLLKERQALSRTLEQSIDDDISRTMTTLFQANDLPAKISLESQVTALEREKRQIQLSSFTDTANLMRELRLAGKELITALMIGELEYRKPDMP